MTARQTMSRFNSVAPVLAMLLVAVTGCTGGHPARPKPPTIRVKQDARHVYLFFRNPNKDWSVRHLHYEISLFSADGAYLAVYADPMHAHPGYEDCCVIPELAPQGTYDATMPPTNPKHPIADVKVFFSRGTWTRQ